MSNAHQDEGFGGHFGIFSFQVKQPPGLGE